MTIRYFAAIRDTKVQFNISFFEMDAKVGTCFCHFCFTVVLTCDGD